MPTNTAGLRIALRRLNGNPMTYHNNPYSQRLMGLNGDLTSYLVRGRSGEAIEVLTKFTKDYKLHGASGVRITIAIGYRVQDPSHLTDTQSFWVDEANLYQTRTFDKISRWSSEVSKAAATRFSIPKLDFEPNSTSRDTLWQELGIANMGCIAVFVTRGDLVNGQVQLRQGRETDPPASHQFRATDIPKVISFDWFKPLENSVHGSVAIMEFRNFGNIDAAPIASGIGESDKAFDTSRASEISYNGEDSDDQNPYDGYETTTPPPRSIPTLSLGNGRHLSQPLATPKDSQPPRVSIHTNGIPHRKLILTNVLPQTSDVLRTSPKGTPSTRDKSLEQHTSPAASSSTTERNSMSPKERAAAAALRRHQEESGKKAISQRRLKSAHQRKRTVSAGDQGGRAGPNHDSGMKRQRQRGDQINASVQFKNEANTHAIVDLTADSDENDLVKVKVEAGRKTYDVDLKPFSRRELENKLLKIMIEEELAERDRDEAT